MIISHHGVIAQSAAQPVNPVQSGLVQWFDAADPSTLLDGVGAPVANGGEIITWLDKSGGGFHATKLLTTGPLRSAALINGRDAVVCNGSSTLSHGLTITGACSVFIVCKSLNGLGVAIAGTSHIYSAAPANANLTSHINAVQGSGPNWGTYLGGEVSSSYDVFTEVKILSYVCRSGVDVDLCTNGVVETKAGGGFYVGDSNDRRWVCGDQNATEGANGPIAEVIAYGRAVTSLERASIEGYLATKWGVTI